MTDDVQIEVVAEEVPEDTPTDEEREESQFLEDAGEVSEEEAKGFVGEVVAEVDDSEVSHDEVRDSHGEGR